MTQRSGFTIALTSILLLASSAIAAEDALSIIRKVDAKERSDTARRELVMTVYPNMDDAYGKREFSVIGYSRGDDDEYMEFVAPKSIKGLRVLAKGGDNWVYFPSTGRTRKIAGKSKKESVQGVGGDFSYEDMGGGTFEEKYDFGTRSESSKSWVLEGVPKKPDGVYSKIVITIDKSNYVVRRIEYHTDEDGHYKDLAFDDVKVMGGREIATRMTMTNLRKRSETLVVIRSAAFDLPVDDKYFNPTRFGK